MRLSLLYEVDSILLFEAQTPVPQYGGTRGGSHRVAASAQSDYAIRVMDDLANKHEIIGRLKASPNEAMPFYHWGHYVGQGNNDWWPQVQQELAGRIDENARLTYNQFVSFLRGSQMLPMAMQRREQAQAQQQPQSQWPPSATQQAGISVSVARPDGQRQTLVVPHGQDAQAYINHMIQTGYLPAGSQILG